jgi:hypothetical protein
MNKYTKLQESVINKANKMLKKQDWYRGVCVDIMRDMDDNVIKRVGTYRAAKKLFADTEFYDNPNIWG